MSTATARAYQPHFAGRFMPSRTRKSPQNKAFYGHRDTYSGKAHCIKDRVLLDICCGTGAFLISALARIKQNVWVQKISEADKVKKYADAQANSLIGVENDPQCML